MEEEKKMVIREGSRILLCDEKDYRDKLYDSFNTAALFGMLKDYMSTLDNPVEFRETIIETWRSTVTDTRNKTLESIREGVEKRFEGCPELIPEELNEESLKQQQDFFNGIIEEMVTEIRATLSI